MAKKKSATPLRKGHYICEAYGPNYRYGSPEYDAAYRGVVDIVWSKGDTVCDCKHCAPHPPPK